MLCVCVGAVLGLHAFLMCGVVTWVLTVLMLTAYKQELRKTTATEAADALQQGLLN